MSWSRDILKGCFMGGTFSIIPRYKKGRCNSRLKRKKHRNRFGTSSDAASEIDSSSQGTATPIRARPSHISCSPAGKAKRGYISLKESVCTCAHIPTCSHAAT